MANQDHLDILKQGVETWNQWRKEHADILPDLSNAHLSETAFSGVNLSAANLRRVVLKRATLSKANLRDANLRGATLSSIDLRGADLRGAILGRANLSDGNLSEANLYRANLRGTDLSRASLNRASLNRADLSKADLSRADLSAADLSLAILVETNLTEVTLTDCHIYGIAAWDVELKGARQNNLVITPLGEPTITVDNLKIAQFIYLLLNNAEIREVIDTITSKVVLILGRFTSEQKAVLDALREELRKHNYSPVLFDFEKPASRDLTETVSTLAHLARFIIVDLTDPSSAPHEVATVIPQTVVPVQPLLSQEPLLIDGKEVERQAYSMFKDLQRRYHWVLPIYSYTDQAHLLATLKEHVIAPAEQKAQELEKR